MASKARAASAIITSDVYERITHRIVEQLETETRPWMQPWGGGGTPVRPLRHNGMAYRGINNVLLWMTAAENGYASRYWMTYKQAAELGGQVRKGETSTLVVYANTIERKETDDAGDEIERRIPFMKGYSVFNADQIDGLPERYRARPMVTAENSKERLEVADRFFANLDADIRHGGNRAFYQPGGDFIQMPPFEAFVSAEAHATTLGHEAIHWTMSPTRLDRNLGRKKWGDEGYAREELVAELGSVFLAADLGLAIEPRDDHAAYIASWLKALKNDKRLVFQMAAHAERAVAYLHRLQPAADNANDTVDEPVAV
ncbi:ArdC family protein [Ensifer canadensis]